MAKPDPAIIAHQEWIGFIQPTGLVVSAHALVRAGAILNRADTEGQLRLRACVETGTLGEGREDEPWIPGFRQFAESVLGWTFSDKWYVGTEAHPVPPELIKVLPEYGETLQPDFAVREPDASSGDDPQWQLLVRILAPGEDLDASTTGHGRLEASAHGRMERLLRNTGVSAGLLFNGRVIRLLSAPRGESSGWMDFKVRDMVLTAGRPLSTALRMLLSEHRLVGLSRSSRLPALLEESRKYQNEVSERLAEQVLHALYELLRGFQSAHDASKGALLRQPLAEHPDEVYRALLTVILRMVFLLYAEERDMLPKEETFLRHYSLAGLHDRLREDAALFPDTMNQRYSAWAQLLVLFRMVHDGADGGAMKLPRRHGVLFDPDRYPFLEGRIGGVARQLHERFEPPLVPDGTIQRALEKLLVLDGERISYRALDVEQIGSVYETMMGFRLETATGPSVEIKAPKKHGAPTTTDLDQLLKQPPGKRERWIRDRTDRKLTGKVKQAVQEADSIEDLHAALMPVIDLAASPDLVRRGAMVLQPSDERRRSGSHYTPRELTAPIVETTLEPILGRLRGADGLSPRPEQILDLKVCDPAMGSGAFLVESCRQLGDALVEAWRAHGVMPAIPADEDEVVYARRMIAQRCLYGVDRNPVAVDLSKMSLWLVTLAKDHALTFVDHALRHGDSLVGLSRGQLEAFHWDPSKPPVLKGLGLRDALDRVSDLRRQIREAGEGVEDWELRDLWNEAQAELDKVRLLGDLAVAAFFEADKAKERERKRGEFQQAAMKGEAGRYRDWLGELRHADPPLAPFHWGLEFPEVFERQSPGFDAFVGNPPFAGKNSVANGNVGGYQDWLKDLHPESHGNADLVAHFFRRTFDLLRVGGAFGLIATNTIAQGDTRASGLRWICKHGGEIYDVRSRVKWPGMAAVVVSVVHVTKGPFEGQRVLDGRLVEQITAFLFHSAGHDDPARLGENTDKGFVGSYLLGMGFTFDDTDSKGVATPIAGMERLIAKDPRNGEVIFPYIGGEEVNDSPTHAHHRYAINFFDRSLKDAEAWPDLVKIVRERVKPERDRQKRKALRERWWQYAEKRPGLVRAIAGLERVLVISRVGQVAAFTFLPRGMVYSERLVVFPLVAYSAFAVLQSRSHEIWARFFSATLKDDLMYAPSDCFETFPIPVEGELHPALEAAGRSYYEFRADLMVRNNEGLTQTYNRFHEPDERDPDIVRLRELHAAMDRAVLDAYGWGDIPTDCDFFLDYEIDEEEWGNKKKPWRYRWPDAVHDEVLARLLDLNAQRAKEEALAGAGRTGGKVKGKKKRARKSPQSEDLFS